MTASMLARRDQATPASAIPAAIGCGALAARPALLAVTGHSTAVLVLLFATLLAVGLAAPIPCVSGEVRGKTGLLFAVCALGVVAFGAGRFLVAGHGPDHASMSVVLANLLAAVAEEVWFRRLCYGLLLPAGTTVAVAGSTALFAAVHIATYGWWIVPLDLAAGALFGWQRAVTGTWFPSAATHMVANLFVLL